MSPDYPYWYANAGSFVDGDNMGTSVTWQSPGIYPPYSQSVYVSMYDRDLPNELGPGDTGSRGDAVTFQDDVNTFRLVRPELVAVNFQPASSAYNLRTNHGDSTVSSTSVAEFQRAVGSQQPTTQHAAVFKKGTKLKAKLSVASEYTLTKSETVDVTADIYGLGELAELELISGQTFGAAWPSTTGTQESDVNLPDKIGAYFYGSILWYYRVPSGTNEWVTIGDFYGYGTTPILVTAAEPVYGPHYEWVAIDSCIAADGVTSDWAKSIMDNIYLNLAGSAHVDNLSTYLHYDFPNIPQDFGVDRLLDDKEGSCGNWVNYFLALCNVQGIDSSAGLKSGDFAFDGYTTASHPWTRFRVTNKGINNGGDPSQPAYYSIVDLHEYPNPDEDEVGSIQKTWWWWGVDQSPGDAFHDHAVVFFDQDGDTDYLYDPSFPPGYPFPVVVTYPGTDTTDLRYTGTSNFMTNYFETSCPCLYGCIGINYSPGAAWLHIYTCDFANTNANPSDIRFDWIQSGGQWQK
jgi:hypothetical protein